MPTEKEVTVIYRQLHDDLSEIYYDGTMGLSKEEFDTQHGMIWGGMRVELIVEGHITIPEPPRDLEVEIDDLKAKLKQAGIT